MSMLKEKLINKLKAASIHLAISMLVFLVVLYLILFEWYPEPFFTAQGGWQGIQLMAMVDLVLGPALTLIVFNHLKKRKEIILDLSVIALIQLSALIWGGLSVYSQRPVALVFWSNAFYTVTSNDYTMQGIKTPSFSAFSKHVPPLIFSRPVANQLEYAQSVQLSEQSVPAYAQIALYEEIDKNLSKVFLNQVAIREVILNNHEMAKQLKKVVHGDISKFNYVGLKAKYQNMILVMDENGNIVGEIKTSYFE